MLDSLFDKVTGLQWLQHRCFLVDISNFLRKTFSIETSGGCFYFYSKGKKRKAWIKRKIFQMKEGNKNILFNFCLQFLVLVKSEMQIQLWKYYWTAHAFFLRFLQIYFLVIPACSFFVFSFLANWKIAVFTLSLHKYFVYINKKCTCSLAWILWIT